ncbi:hypothetical protein GCM10009743_22830 [Kribbella swartbergensis]
MSDGISAIAPVLAEAAELLCGMALFVEGGEFADPPRLSACSRTDWPARSRATATPVAVGHVSQGLRARVA